MMNFVKEKIFQSIKQSIKKFDEIRMTMDQEIEMIQNQSNSFRRSGVPVEKKSKNFNQNQKLKKIQLVSFFWDTQQQ